MSHRLHFIPRSIWRNSLHLFSIHCHWWSKHTCIIHTVNQLHTKGKGDLKSWFKVLYSLIYTPFSNTALLFPLSSSPPNPPAMLFIPSTTSHQILLEAIPTWNLIIHPICLSSFPLQSLHLSPISVVSNGGNGGSDSRLWSRSGPLSPLPTYTAHLRGWTWWQPPPPRCRPCSSSDPPAPSGCPRCAASRCRWMFPGTCLMHCLPSSSTVPGEERRKCWVDKDAVRRKRGVLKDRISQRVVVVAESGSRKMQQRERIQNQYCIVGENENWQMGSRVNETVFNVSHCVACSDYEKMSQL